MKQTQNSLLPKPLDRKALRDSEEIRADLRKQLIAMHDRWHKWKQQGESFGV